MNAHRMINASNAIAALPATPDRRQVLQGHAVALTLSWRDLASVTPWGDAYDGFTPAGRQVTVERSYLWADQGGGDILCEVVVYGGPSRWAEAARAHDVIRAVDPRGRPHR